MITTRAFFLRIADRQSCASRSIIYTNAQHLNEISKRCSSKKMEKTFNPIVGPNHPRRSPFWRGNQQPTILDPPASSTIQSLPVISPVNGRYDIAKPCFTSGAVSRKATFVPPLWARYLLVSMTQNGIDQSQPSIWRSSCPCGQRQLIAEVNTSGSIQTAILLGRTCHKWQANGNPTSEETIKTVGPFYLVSMPVGDKCETGRGLQHKNKLLRLP